MKKFLSTKKIVITILVFFTISSFTTYLILDAAKVRNKILESLFISVLYRDDAEYIKENYPDTTLLFNNPIISDNKNEKHDPTKKFVLAKMSMLPYIGAIGSQLCGEGDDNYFGSPTFETKFKQEYGVSWEGKSFDMAQVYGEDENGKTLYSRFVYYNPLAIKAAFAKLYSKPDGKFQQISYKSFYGLVGKAYLRDFTKLLINLRVTQKAKWNSITANYLKQAKTNLNFKVHEISSDAFLQLFPKEEDSKKYPKFSNDIYPSTIGSLIRRECDGSLSAIIDCIKIVLKDYDPEMYKQAQVL